MFSTTKTLTKTLMMAATLTLAAGCDAEPEAADFVGDEDVTFRPTGGIRLNTSFLGGFEFSELDTHFGTPHDGAVLIKVCVVYKKDPICLDKVWVEDGQIYGAKNSMLFKGWDFLRSTWSLKLDYDRDGGFDSSITTEIIKMSANFTPGGKQYLTYAFAYDSSTASGLIQKYIEQSKELVPTCEVDVDTGSIEAVVIRDLTVDRKSGDMADRKSTMQIACISSAVGKLPTWNYLHHDIGTKVYETATRMVRMDACGDGTSFTEPGQKLQVADNFGLSDFFDPAGKDEAMWVVGGAAVCVTNPRHPNVTFQEIYDQCGLKPCKDGATMADYGADFHTKLVP